MSIFIYNSLSRKKEEFLPSSPPKVNLYTCGVTVYDECHIGHARSLYVFDVIRRYLKYRGFEVRFVRNITDIEDKIINRANELKVGWQELVRKYIDSYYRDLEALGIEKADAEPRATENIEEMKRYIGALIARGFAYATSSGVYFNVRKSKEYGKLSGQGIDQMLTGARKEPDETKEDPLDFALWKVSKPGEPSWESPWGAGRPGWHIECSVMSQRFLDTDTLDIHAGGRDLIFPHHENEIAQSEALTGKLFAKYWIHHGLLTINGQKMAKSLGNFVTIKDFIGKYKYADILKLFFLSTHYSHPIDYTEEKIEEANRRLASISLLMGEIDKKLSEQKNRLSFKDSIELKEIKNKFISAMDDDFNTPLGLAAISDLVKMMNKNIGDLEFISQAKDLWIELAKIFCLDYGRKDTIINLESINTSAKMLDGRVVVISAETIELCKKRDEARKRKDFKEADKIRKQLESKGFIVEDTQEGTRIREKP